MASVASVAPQASSKARPSSTAVQRLRSSTEGTLKSWDEKISFFQFFLNGTMHENAIFGEMFFVVLFLYCVSHVVSLFFSVPVVRCSCVSLVVLLLCFCCFVSVSALLLLCFCLSAPLLFHKSEMQLQYVTNIVQTTTQV